MKKHYFIDEAGDTTFYKNGKAKIPIIGNEGVSNIFLIGMANINGNLNTIRQDIILYQKELAKSAYYKKIPSVIKRVSKGGFFFHAKDDLPEIRKEFFDFIKPLNINFCAVVGRKKIDLFEKKHDGKEVEFYTDMFAHLLKLGLDPKKKTVFNVAERANSTTNKNLEYSLNKAKNLYMKKNEETDINVAFSVHRYQDEALLTISDYLCWAVQRVFEQGETRFYEYMIDFITNVYDIYDFENRVNVYTKNNPLTEKNKVSPHAP